MEPGLTPSTYLVNKSSMNSYSNTSFMGISIGHFSRQNQTTTFHVQLKNTILGVFLGLVSLLTILMNTLVLYAVKKEKTLQTVGNLYIVSLSVADLMVGATVMPINLVYLLQDRWELGYSLCQVWLITDYVASTASIFSVFILCLDRYRSVRQPLKYLKYRTKANAYIIISGAWLLSMMWIIPILGWRFFTNFKVKPEEEDKCDTDFRFVTWFKVLTAIFNFYLPSILMVVLYILIYRAVRQHLKAREKNVHPTDSSREKENGLNNQNVINLSHSPNGKTPKSLRKQLKQQKLFDQSSLNVTSSFDRVKKVRNASFSVNRKVDVKMETKERFSEKAQRCPLPPEAIELTETGLNQDMTCPMGDNRCNLKASPNRCHVTRATTEVEGSCHNDDNSHDSCPSEPWTKIEFEGTELDQDDAVTLKHSWQKFKGKSCHHIQSLKIHKQQKAAKQLGFIIGTFLICWIPYFIVFMVMAFCQECVHHDLHMFTIWLGYITSTLNPFIYPLCNDNFRRVFKKILKINE